MNEIVIKGTITLKQGRDHSIKRFHPWIFSGGIQQTHGEPSDGDWVEVQDAKKTTVGFGHYQKGSITARILVFGDEKPIPSIYYEKISKAFEQRIKTFTSSESTNSYR